MAGQPDQRFRLSGMTLQILGLALIGMIVPWATGCSGGTPFEVIELETTSPQGRQFLTGWTQQMAAFEGVSAAILTAPALDVDPDMPDEERIRIGVERTREDAEKYTPVIEGLEALEPPEDDASLQILQELSLKLLHLIQDDLLDIAAQAEATGQPQPNPDFTQDLVDTLEQMVAIADLYGADTDVLLNQIEGIEIDHDHED